INSPAVTFEYYTGATAGTAGNGTTTAPTNAGTYAVRASYAGNTNYNGSSATRSITINPANTSVAITWTDPQTYNGSTHPATASVTGPVAADNPINSPAVSFAYYAGSNPNSLTDAPPGDAPTDAADYTLIASDA